MTAATATNTVNFTGTNDLELIATGTDIATIDASGMGTGGTVVPTGRTRTASSTYTGSAGDDTFIMLNISDTLSGGAGTDTLDINYPGNAAIIDLPLLTRSLVTTVVLTLLFSLVSRTLTLRVSPPTVQLLPVLP